MFRLGIWLSSLPIVIYIDFRQHRELAIIAILKELEKPAFL